MGEALVKAISFITFIGIGLLFKRKFKSKEEVDGLKKIILYLALPATIFIALLKIHIDFEFLMLPFLALAFNVFLFILGPMLLNVVGVSVPSERNSAKLLIASLAPGLSCFPFILEFLGDSYLAKAAMADLGNKFFVLFILYLLAMRWYYAKQKIDQGSLKTKMYALAKAMLLEPINIIIILALILVSFGIGLVNLPLFLQDNLDRLSMIMTPLVLLFIGLAVKIKGKQCFQILSLLLLRAGIAVLAISGLSYLSGVTMQEDLLWMMAFGLSACSFWPFAHISIVASKEIDVPTNNKTFDPDFALTILAISLPLSVLLILGVLTFGDVFMDLKNSVILGATLIGLALLYPLITWVRQYMLVGSRVEQFENY